MDTRCVFRGTQLFYTARFTIRYRCATRVHTLHISTRFLTLTFPYTPHATRFFFFAVYAVWFRFTYGWFWFAPLVSAHAVLREFSIDCAHDFTYRGYLRLRSGYYTRSTYTGSSLHFYRLRYGYRYYRLIYAWHIDRQFTRPFLPTHRSPITHGVHGC